MQLTITNLAAFALVSVTGIHATELRGSVVANNAAAKCPADAIRRCRKTKRKCTAYNTLSIRCTGDGTSTSSIAETDMTKEDFQNGEPCKGACASGMRCNAQWRGSWSCGGMGETVELELMAEEEDEDFERPEDVASLEEDSTPSSSGDIEDTVTFDEVGNSESELGESIVTSGAFQDQARGAAEKYAREVLVLDLPLLEEIFLDSSSSIDVRREEGPENCRTHPDDFCRRGSRAGHCDRGWESIPCDKHCFIDVDSTTKCVYCKSGEHYSVPDNKCERDLGESIVTSDAFQDQARGAAEKYAREVLVLDLPLLEEIFLDSSSSIDVRREEGPENCRTHPDAGCRAGSRAGRCRRGWESIPCDKHCFIDVDSTTKCVYCESGEHYSVPDNRCEREAEKA